MVSNSSRSLPRYNGRLFVDNCRCVLVQLIRDLPVLSSDADSLLLGFIANAYPEESYKGRWRSVQWVFNMSGACVGGIVALG